MTLFDIHFQAVPDEESKTDWSSADLGKQVEMRLITLGLRPTVSAVHKTGDKGSAEKILRAMGDPVPVKEAVAAWDRDRRYRDFPAEVQEAIRQVQYEASLLTAKGGGDAEVLSRIFGLCAEIIDFRDRGQVTEEDPLATYKGVQVNDGVERWTPEEIAALEKAEAEEEAREAERMAHPDYDPFDDER